MSLYGSLFSAISGLNAQGDAIAMVSDNISNLNTVGYKGSTAFFSTLTTSSFGSTRYSSGGVLSSAVRSINQQGLLKSTGQNTDLAITGNGFFVLNDQNDGSGNTYYTRAGSFIEDANGNLINTSGYYLMGWPLDSEGRLPGQTGNLDTTSYALLQSTNVVNVQSISGSASETTQVSLGINLNSSEKFLKGTGDTILFPSTSVNTGISATQVISPDTGATTAFNIGDTFTLTPSDPGNPYTFTYGGIAVTTALPVLGAATVTAGFTGATSGDGFTLTTIINQVSTTYTYTYTPTSPTSTLGQFNSLTTLASAISASTGVSARVVGTQLLITNYNDADQALTFANNNVSGASNFATALGIVGTPVAAAAAGVNRFATLEDLYTKINLQSGLTAILNNPLSAASVQFYATDPTGTLNISAVGQVEVAPLTTSTQATIFAQLGVNPPLLPVLDQYQAAYVASAATTNFAGGFVTPQFSRNIRVYDAFGTPQDLQVSFGKIGYNDWAVEIYVLDKTSIISSRTDGQIANGTIQFNGDGTLRNVSASLSVPITIQWTDQALTSAITFNWGTAGSVAGTVGALQIGEANGLRQLDQAYTVDFVDQNGISAGLLSGISVDAQGHVIAQFSNGTTRNIYQLPVAKFTSPDNLSPVAGNAFAQTTLSGDYNLFTAGTGGVGSIVPGTLEQSNVELSEELTNMIIAQRAYQSSTKVIKTVNEMLEDLNRIF